MPAVARRRRSRLEERLLREVGRACRRYGLLEPGDRVMVAVSGGKDSLCLLHLLRELRARVPFDYSIVAVHLDQKQPGYPEGVLARYFEEAGYEYRIVEQDTYSIVVDKLRPGDTYCSLCSRLRRGILYRVADELGATKIALGHHRDDLIETLLLNIFYSGRIKAMPARLVTDDGRHVVVRPLASCAEADLAALAQELELPVIPCGLCGNQANLKRDAMKRLVAQLAAENPKVPGNLFAALHHVVPSHLLDPHLRREPLRREPLRREPLRREPLRREPDG